MSPEAVTALFDEDAALPARMIAYESPASWHRAGLLSSWVDDAGRANLEDVLGVPLDGQLLSWAACTGERECDADVLDTLWGAVALRLLGHHFSLLRLRLAVLLSPEAYFGDPALRAWIVRHVHVVGVPVETALAVELDLLVQPRWLRCCARRARRRRRATARPPSAPSSTIGGGEWAARGSSCSPRSALADRRSARARVAS